MGTDVDERVFVHICDTAERDDNIRAAMLYGSRIFENTVKDEFCDFDIYYVVNSLEDFDEKYSDMRMFGDTSLTYRPDKAHPTMYGNTLQYCIFLLNGKRIDLSVADKRCFAHEIETEYSECPMKVLIDKDGDMPDFGNIDESVYNIKPPEITAFNLTCDEFFWNAQRVAKGMARKEIPETMYLRDVAMRDPFNRMLDWHIGIHHDFNVSTGRWGKDRGLYLEPELNKAYNATYTNADMDNILKSVLAMFKMFDELAKEVSAKYDFGYSDKNMIFVRRYFKSLF